MLSLLKENVHFSFEPCTTKRKSSYKNSVENNKSSTMWIKSKYWTPEKPYYHLTGYHPAPTLSVCPSVVHPSLTKSPRSAHPPDGQLKMRIWVDDCWGRSCTCMNTHLKIFIRFPTFVDSYIKFHVRYIWFNGPTICPYKFTMEIFSNDSLEVTYIECFIWGVLFLKNGVLPIYFIWILNDNYQGQFFVFLVILSGSGFFQQGCFTCEIFL